MDNFTHYWLTQKNLAAQGKSLVSQPTPQAMPQSTLQQTRQQNSKCVQSWEEYKKLDSAYHDLHREYFALRGEQMGFSNVPKDWLVRMRDLRGRCLELARKKVEFLNEVSPEELEKMKLLNLQNKLMLKQELSLLELKFLYSIDAWPSYEIRERLKNILKFRDEEIKRKDLSKVLECRECQISFNQEEYENAKEIIYHDGNLDFINCIEVGDLKLPKYINGRLRLDGLINVKKLILPERVGGDLVLRALRSAKGLVWPKEIGGRLNLYSLESTEGLVLPEKISGDLSLNSLHSAKGLVLPEKIGGWLTLQSLTSAEGLVLPKKIVGSLDLSGLTSAEGLVLPETIGGEMTLSSLRSAEGLVFPKKIGRYLQLSHLTSTKGLILDHCNVRDYIYLNNLSIAEKDKLRAKYPHLANKIK